MKRIVISLVGFVLTALPAYSQYISPGIRLGYDFKAGFNLGLKLSAGVDTDGSTISLTFGRKFGLGGESKFKTHNYIDLQAGRLSDTMGERKIQLFYGGGAGIIFYKENGKTVYHPRVTGFVGYIVFTTLDINLINWKNPESDLGLQLVLPIPLGEPTELGTGG